MYNAAERMSNGSLIKGQRLFFPFQQEIDDMAVKDAVSLGGKESIHGDDHLFIVVLDLV